MVATRGQRRNEAAQEQEQAQPPKTNYERLRDNRVAQNNEKLEALGLKKISTEFNNSLPPPTKGKKSGNKNTSSIDSETSEYLLEEDDQGDSDDDDTESVEQPQPLAMKVLAGARKKTLISKKSRNKNMAPVGRGKRVRASEHSKEQPPAAPLRSSKRLQTQEKAGHNNEHPEAAISDVPSQVQENDSSAGHDTAQADSVHIGHDSAAADDDSGFGGTASRDADDDNVAAEDGPAERAPRKPRCPTKGKQLDKMTKAMRRRLPIQVEEGNKRPHDPVQSAKFASEAGVIIRETMPILTHWKEYKKDTTKYFDAFVGELGGRLAVNKKHEPTKEACTDVMRTTIKNQRYRLKKQYFNGVPANEVRTTSPVDFMTDKEWRALVAKWSDPKNMETCEKNKLNRMQVQYHQATGSRPYVAHLHAYKQKRAREEPSLEEDDELDVVEAFKSCHTSSKHGLSEQAKKALSEMEAMSEDLKDAGYTIGGSVDVLSTVLPKGSSQQFLKSVGLKTPTSSKSTSTNETELREQLAAEARAAVQGEVEDLKKKSAEAEERMERQEKELEEYKQLVEKNTKEMEKNREEMEENRVLLRGLLKIYAPSSST